MLSLLIILSAAVSGKMSGREVEAKRKFSKENRSGPGLSGRWSGCRSGSSNGIHAGNHQKELQLVFKMPPPPGTLMDTRCEEHFSLTATGDDGFFQPSDVF